MPRSVRSSLWAFAQPAMSPELHMYVLLQLGVVVEACLSLLRGMIAHGSQLDMMMIAHHSATLLASVLSYRMGFVRVGAAVSFLHNASDLPLDLIRIAQAFQWEGLLQASSLAAVVSWSVARVYCFPRFIIASALLETAHLRTVYSFLPAPLVAVYFAGFLAPLVLIWLLSCCGPRASRTHEPVGPVVGPRGR